MNAPKRGQGPVGQQRGRCMRSVARPFQRRWQPLVALAAVAALIGCERLSPEERAAAEAHEQWQLVDRYCVDCHNDAELAGELSLDSLVARQHRGQPGDLRESRPQVTRASDAAAEGAAAGRAATVVVRLVGRGVARSSRRRSRAAAHRVAPAQSQGILERRPRSARLARSMPPRSCRKTSRSRASTTSRRRCRCRRRSSSST